MLTYPASIPLSTRSLTRLTELIRDRRRALGGRWRRLAARQQALMALAHLRNGDTLTRLAAGFAVSVSTVWRYLREAVDLLAACADDLAAAMRRAARLAYAILDGTLIPIDRVADQRPYYSGKHKRHGVNVQVLADAAGRLVWTSAALPGAVHDLTAARTHGLIDALTSANVLTVADKGYQGAGGSVRTPFKRHRHRPKLSHRQRTVNRGHARLRARGERAIATLKTWKVLAKLRCCPRRATAIVQAILVLHRIETSRHSG
ncbi:transposase family protein [Micromonospora sp. C95]|uniref:transposase family protein n=1 Tax=Micromonospora sp. C95 TaxID=2824882 RepID=UPI001B38969B|nr:transposase family protein [Micromonospora sp. C95]MBQ1022786.1 transposase family protein [Micromonospora sp. C95]